MANLPELRERWRQLCLDVIDYNTSEAEWYRLCQSYQEPNRAYHNLEHIEFCLKLLSENLRLVQSPIAVEFALFFHDAIYDPKSDVNEERSCMRAHNFLADLPYDSETCSLILATKHRAVALTGDKALLVDIDLAILGEAPAAYDDYAAKIRQEYRHIADVDYAKGRVAVLQGFLSREHIYHTNHFRNERETQARENLKREIEQLNQG